MEEKHGYKDSLGSENLGKKIWDGTVFSNTFEAAKKLMILQQERIIKTNLKNTF